MRKCITKSVSKYIILILYINDIMFLYIIYTWNAGVYIIYIPSFQLKNLVLRMYSEALWKTNSTKMMGALALESGNIVLVSQQFLNTFYVHNAVLET